MVSSSGLSSSFLFVSAEGCLPKILCETLISVLPKVSPAKNMLAASSIRCIKVWWLIVSWLSPKLGTIQFVSSSSSVMPEVFDSIKLGCSFSCFFSDTITASSIKVGLIMPIFVIIPCCGTTDSSLVVSIFL